MQTWDLSAISVEPQRPEVLHSEDEGRVIALALAAGDGLPDHQVHERAWLVVVSGRVEVGPSDGESASGGPGFLATFEPGERHEVVATEDSRLLLILGPWPGEGHPRRRNES